VVICRREREAKEAQARALAVEEEEKKKKKQQSQHQKPSSQQLEFKQAEVRLLISVANQPELLFAHSYVLMLILISS
jgi:hypothetical protein